MHRIKTEAPFIALMLGMLLAQLDTNVVVAALPTISTDLGQPSSLAGVTASYLLAVTVSTPVFGSLSARWGARCVFFTALAMFALGSAACTSAPSMPALVVARGLQGLGGGGLVVSAISTLPQLFNREELIRRQVWVTTNMAVAALAGPPLGGWLAAEAGWRWVFLINLPICTAAVPLGRRLPADTAQQGERFDYAGAALVLLLGAVIVALGSSEWVASRGWASTLLLGLAVLSGLALLHTERRAPNPLIPLPLFNRPLLSRSIAATGLTGVALFGTFTFVPMTIVATTGTSAAGAATLLLALTGGQLAATLSFSLLARRLPNLLSWGRSALSAGVIGLLSLAAPWYSPFLLRPHSPSPLPGWASAGRVSA